MLYVIKNLKPEKLRYKLSYGDQYIAIDRDSGGYPYFTELHRAHVFSDLESAKDYMRVFKGSCTYNSDNWVICILNISATPV
jgi:hypothetical protein